MISHFSSQNSEVPDGTVSRLHLMGNSSQNLDRGEIDGFANSISVSGALNLPIFVGKVPIIETSPLTGFESKPFSFVFWSFSMNIVDVKIASEVMGLTWNVKYTSRLSCSKWTTPALNSTRPRASPQSKGSSSLLFLFCSSNSQRTCL